MKVLFINENIGGHATVHLNLRRALADRPDVDATFIDLPPPAGLSRLAGTRIPGLAGLDLDLQPLRAQLARSGQLARILRGRHAADLASADVVHLYTHNAGLLSIGAWRRVPTVVSLDTTNAQNGYRLPGRSPTPLTPLTVAATKPFERRVYAAAARIVANSEWAAASLYEDYRIGRDRVVVQPFGIEPPEQRPRPVDGPGARDERPRLVFVGKTLERKGGHRLLDVHQRWFADRVDLTLVTKEPVIGGAGVTVVGDLEPGDRRLWDLLEASSIFVFPSEIDMAPNAVIEAMMAGLPIIARPVGAIPEMVLHGVNGLLVDPSDSDLALAIERLIDDPDERRAMGAASRTRALARYDARSTTAALLDILADAAVGPRSRT